VSEKGRHGDECMKGRGGNEIERQELVFKQCLLGGNVVMPHKQ
jgi:hypothetical protein